MSTNFLPADEGHRPDEDPADQHGMSDNDASVHLLDDIELLERVLGIRFKDLPSMLLKPAEVAEILDVPISTVRKMTTDGSLPSRLVGTNRRVPVPALIRWLTSTEAA